MTNNLRVLKKELKSFAKKVKDFKYTDSALITFLLTGTVELGVTLNAHAAQDEIETQKKVINTSISDMHQQFKRVKSENDKLMKDYNLELIQLMEQGDHVVKSPWSSWQYGINGIYNDWQGKYKGRGDKTPDVKYERDKTLAKYKYNTNPNKAYGYGNTTELGLKQEPNAVIPVSASLQPLIPRIKTANVSMAVDISDLPSFTPRTVTPPSAPVVSTSVTFTPPTFSLVGESLGNGGDDYFDYSSSHYYPKVPATATTPEIPARWDGSGHGIIEGVSILTGNFATELTGVSTSNTAGYAGNKFRSSGYWKYGYNDYTFYNASNAPVTGNNSGAISPAGISVSPGLSGNYSRGATTTVTNTGSDTSKTGFLKMASYEGRQSSTMINNANLIYTKQNPTSANVGVKEVVHLDTHGAQPISAESARVNTVLNNFPTDPVSAVQKVKVKNAWDDFKDITTAKGLTHSQTFINSGKTVIEGEKVAFSNSYDHTNGRPNAKWTATVINTGDIVVHPMKRISDGGVLNSDAAVFVVSPEVYGFGNATTGTNGIAQILYNSGNIKLYNKNSAVFFINPDPYERTINTTARRDITIVNRKGEIKEYGEGSVGTYIKTPNYVRQLNLDFSNKSTNNGTNDWSPMTLYGDNSIGLYIEKVTNDTSDKDYTNMAGLTEK